MDSLSEESQHFILFILFYITTLILLISLIKRLYKTEIVYAKFYKEIDDTGYFYPDSGSFSSRQLYSFNSKDGKRRTREFLCHLLKVGKNVKLIYSRPLDALVCRAKNMPFLILLFIFSVWFLTGFTLKYLFFSIIITILVVYLYIKKLDRKINKKSKTKK